MGASSAAVMDATEEILTFRAISIQQAVMNNVVGGESTRPAPSVVATPFPPLK